MSKRSANGKEPISGGQLNSGSTPPQNLPANTVLFRLLIAILLPLGAAVLVGALTGTLGESRPGSYQATAAPMLAALGIVSWFLGLIWYRLPGVGLRGRRPLFAGIGFAVLGWFALIIARILPTLPNVAYDATGRAIVELSFLVDIIAFRSAGSGRVFLYLLLFEAFATQLWAFGVVFRSLADWRGGLTAAVAGGILFGAVGLLVFQEAFADNFSSLFFFLLWGVLYGVIRLRTGSLLGPVIVQALQSFTVWFVLQPPPILSPSGLQIIYLSAGVLYLLIIWRLWPRQESDYRI